MRTVWKHALPLEATHHTFDVPRGAKIVHVALQGGVPTVWLEVDPDEKVFETMNLFFVGTGHVVREGTEHRGTVVMYGDSLVLHVYEGKRDG